MAEAEVHGTVAEGFEPVRATFEASLASGEVGAGVAAYVDGEPVVELWGGFADEERTRAWRRDTIVNTFSTTKGMTATCAHRLIERDLLDPDERVATYWPEFAHAGKEDVRVRHLLTHQAGLPALAVDLPREQRLDWDTVTAALAAQEPAWEPGSRAVYHALTFGYLVGELVRRADGRSLGTYFREEVAEPLGADYLIGFGPEHDHRCAEVVPPPPGPDGELSPAARVNAGMARGTHTRRWRAAEVPAANGHGTADGVARVYAALARGGTLDGVEVLRPDTIEAATVRQKPGGVGGSLTQATPGALQLPFAVGYMLIGDFLALAAGEGETALGTRMFGHPGAGGSIGGADPDTRLGFGYVMNQMQAGMTGGANGFALLHTALRCAAAAA